MPSQNGARRHDGDDAGEEAAAETVAQLPKASTLTVVQTQTPTLEACLQHAVLLAEEGDHGVLFALPPCDKHGHEDVKRKHGRSLRQRCAILSGTLRAQRIGYSRPTCILRRSADTQGRTLHETMPRTELPSGGNA